MILSAFNIIELTTATVAILGALGLCCTRILAQAEQSRCNQINMCCLKCDREVPQIVVPPTDDTTEPASQS